MPEAAALHLLTLNIHKFSLCLMSMKSFIRYTQYKHAFFLFMIIISYQPFAYKRETSLTIFIHPTTLPQLSTQSAHKMRLEILLVSTI